MADRDKIIRYFRAGGDEKLASHLVDLAEHVRKTGRYQISDFLDPHGLNVAEIVAANFENIHLETQGGFSGAERQRAAFITTDFPGKVDFNLTGFLVQWDQRYYHLGHRDILGAFMGIGCKREVLGDIVVLENGGQFVCEQALGNYIAANLTTVGAAAVILTEVPVNELKAREEKVKVISATVAALRLDAVAAAGYGTSRSRMAEEIKGQNVKVNWQDVKNAAQAVKEGDILSFRGRGRVEIAEVRGMTKKGRLSITLKRYL